LRYLEELRRIGVEKSKGFPDENFIVRGLWRTDLLFRPNPAERTFNYTYLLVQTVGEGACYCSTIPALSEGFYLLGQDARTADFKYRCFEVATIDALFSAFEKHPTESKTMTGSSNEKALWRSGIVVDEVLRLLDPDAPRRAKVVNVGVIGNIVRMLLDHVISPSSHAKPLPRGVRRMAPVSADNIAFGVHDFTLTRSTPLSAQEITVSASPNKTEILTVPGSGRQARFLHQPPHLLLPAVAKREHEKSEY